MTFTAPARHLSSLVCVFATALLATSMRAQADAHVVAQAPSLTVEQAEALAERAFAKYAPVGMALAIVQDGKLLYETGLGSRGDGTMVTPTTMFNIASCTKAFTAALMAQLVGEGAVAWDDRVIDHMPEFRMQDPWITAHMTLRDLLSHRCGLETFQGDLLWYGSDYSDAEVVARLEQLPIKQAFRSEFGYQNIMYLVAGMVLERKTGKSWEELVEGRLMQPLGMTASVASAQRLPEGAEIALPHISGQQVEDHTFVACKPAASIYSSVHDVSHWIVSLCANGQTADGKRILGEAAFAEMWKPHVNLGGGAGATTSNFRSYGLGWFLELNGDDKVVEHDGGMPGFLSKVSLIPSQGFGFVILNNGNDGILNEAFKRAIYTTRNGGDGLAILDRIAQVSKRFDARDAAAVKQRESLQKADTRPTHPLADYAGRYTDKTYGSAEVRIEGGDLHVTLLPSKRRLFGKMSHWHDDVFRVDFPDRFLPFALFRFDSDFAGEVAGFRIECPIADFDFGALDFRRQEPKSR